MNTSEIKNVEFKLIIPESTEGLEIINSDVDILAGINSVLNDGGYRTLYISKFTNKEAI